MFDKLEDLLVRFEEVLNELGEPGVTDNQERFQKLMKEQSELQPIVDAYKEYKDNKETIQDSLSMLEEEKDEEMREMLKEELSDAKKRVEELEKELKILLLPKDPNDSKNVIVEIRAGAGGDEAALFAAEIYRMYVKYAESRRWKTEMMSLNENGIGGFKEVTFMIQGQGAYSRLKYESGVHRVQRVPETESGGRIHTSTCTVAIMPEAEEIDFHLDMNDCKFDVFRASGNGGQCVNTTDSAVRLTHIPTGIVISCQDEKSQLKNKDKALKVLRSRLYEMELAKQHDAEAEARRSQIGTGDRSEKIRTYNFPQGRVTDHRIKLTLHRLDAVLGGDLDEILDSLIASVHKEDIFIKKTALVIMAAGIGSRFGKGIKQLAPVGPNGEIIMDYSIHDALEAGFNKVVFIIRKDLEEEFRRVIGERIEKITEVEYAFQALEDLPAGFEKPADRTKPWGTGQAVLAAKAVLNEPFMVINADDYYGKEAYVKVHDYLIQEQPDDGILHICMAGFRLGNTLSDNGSVTRGVCHIEEGALTGVTETHNIFKTADGAEARNDDKVEKLDVKSLVSMNMWGLTPVFMDTLEKGFVDFLSEIKEGDIKKEYLLPEMIDCLIKEGKAKVDVLETKDTWFGVTYQEDKAAVTEAFANLVKSGVYPSNLYK